MGCGPVAALMLLAFYYRRYGYKKLVRTKYESFEGLSDELIVEIRKSMKTVDVQNKTQALTLQTRFHFYLKEFYSFNN